MTPALRSLDRVGIVLVHTSHPGNVGAVARAMKVMGLSDLRLVAPRFADVRDRAEAIAFASGATDVLAAARLFDTLDDAIADASLAVAVSADAREFGPAAADPETCAISAIDEVADPARRVAFVFGCERVGLSIAQVQRCQLLASIPADPGYSSLNLAQAAQVIAYCLRRAALAADAAVGRASEAASGTASGEDSGSAAARIADQRAIEGLFEHLERALVAVDFLDPRHPKKLMPRLRRLFARARLEQEEVDLLRGICKQMERSGGAPGQRDRQTNDDEAKR
jgi:tRNA/rRNA methyltransferase